MTDYQFNTGFDPVIGLVEEIAPGLRRIVAPNASPMTFRGTNTYILGNSDLAVIDPGPPGDVHLERILAAVGQGQRISHILVTHSHVDHSPLARRLADQNGAPVYALGDSFECRSAMMKELAATTQLSGGEGVDQEFRPDNKLADNEVINGAGWTLDVVATPGHFSNHISFGWREGQAVFTGDQAMGWASTMVSPPDGDIADFMASLDRLEARIGDQHYYPGHGAPVEGPYDLIRHLRTHRQAREEQIMAALEAGPFTPTGLAEAIYTDVPAGLLPAATRNVFAHLVDLVGKNHVEVSGEMNSHAVYKRVDDLT